MGTSGKADGKDTSKDGKDKKDAKDKKDSKPGLTKSDGTTLPLKDAPAPPPPPPPVPNLPPGATMGGFPGAPQPQDQPSSLQAFIRDNLTVRLRDGGVLRPYGFFRGDLDFASNRFNDIQNPFFVLPQDPRFRTGPNAVPMVEHEPNHSLYPRLTRLGFEYFGGPIEMLDNAKVSGRIEVDWLTNNIPTAPNVESRELLRLRLAYAQIQHDGFTFLMGQDWDVIAPLLPTINDNTLMWSAGNLGDRRPIAKFLYDHQLNHHWTLQIQNAMYLADAITNIDLDGDGFRDAESQLLPGWQGRLGLVGDSWVEGEKILTGVWGAVGRDHTRAPIGPTGRHVFLSEVIGADLRLPLVPGLTFQGELFHGKNLDDLRGGIAQGINPTQGREIYASGGWAELVYRPCCWYQVGIGATVDNPDDDDLIGLNAPPNANAGRKLNYTFYWSNRFILDHGLTIGADYINWNTEYIAYNKGHASLIKFFVAQSF